VPAIPPHEEYLSFAARNKLRQAQNRFAMSSEMTGSNPSFVDNGIHHDHTQKRVIAWFSATASGFITHRLSD
jgi:hypothetical protein